MKRTSAELKQIARGNLSGHYGLAIGASVVAGLIVSAALLPFNFIYQINPTGGNYTVYTIANTIISLVSVLLSCGLIRIHLKLSRKEQPVFSDLFYCFTKRPDRFLLEGLILLGINFLCTLPGNICLRIGSASKAVTIIIMSIPLLLIGYILSIFVSLFLALVYVLLTDHDSMGTMDAFHTSIRLMEGNKKRLLYIQLSFIGWILLALCSCGIGFLWLMPYLNQTTVVFYRDLIGELDLNTDSENKKHSVC